MIVSNIDSDKSTEILVGTNYTVVEFEASVIAEALAPDFNSDGQTDMLWRNQAKGQNILWLMNGTTIAQGVSLAAVDDLNWQMVG